MSNNHKIKSNYWYPREKEVNTYGAPVSASDYSTIVLTFIYVSYFSGKFRIKLDHFQNRTIFSYYKNAIL